jgi:hypothetical protein
LQLLQAMELHGNFSCIHCVLVDKVDSILPDKAKHMCAVSHRIESFRKIEEILVRVWEQVHRPGMDQIGFGEIDEVILLLSIKETVNNEIKSKGLVSDCSCNDIEYMSLEYFVGRRLEIGILMAFQARQISVGNQYIFEADAENMS